MTFDFFIDGYFHDHNYRLVLNDDILSISDYAAIPVPEHDKKISIYSNQDWEILLEFLKQCKWKRRYESEILDGTQWNLKIMGNGVRINSYGSNAYPEDFKDFLTLLNKVMKEVGVNVSI